MVNEYFESIPIYEEREAKILGSDSGWSILRLLRSHGSNGCTAEEISSILDLPISTVYNVLGNLRAVGYVHTQRFSKRAGRPDQASIDQEMRTGKQKRIYRENISWGSFGFTSEFRGFLNEEVDELIDASDIKKVCSTVIDKIITKMKNNSNCSDFLPVGEKCRSCHAMHEADEYAAALVAAISRYVFQSQELDKVLKKHGFAA